MTLTVDDQGSGFAASAADRTRAGVSQSARAGHGLPLALRLVDAQHARLDVLPPPGGHVAIRLRRVDATPSQPM